MDALNRRRFLLITALVEAPLGLLLVVFPATPLALLLGLEPAAAETLFVGRIAGAALLALGIASWLARADPSAYAQRGLLTGLSVYNTVVTILLAIAGTTLDLAGVLLWPAVGLHTFLGIWCLWCLLCRNSVSTAGGGTGSL